MFIKPVAEFLVLLRTFVINNYIKTNNFPENCENQSNTKNSTTYGIKRLQTRFNFASFAERLCKLVLKHLAVFIEEESVCHQYQSGYRKKHSTATLLIKPHDDTKNAMKSSKVTVPQQFLLITQRLVIQLILLS